jgi:lipopolysaccharide/colanic/teichoic acid biosynthesis glycosyltransferase
MAFIGLPFVFYLIETIIIILLIIISSCGSINIIYGCHMNYNYANLFTDFFKGHFPPVSAKTYSAIVMNWEGNAVTNSVNNENESELPFPTRMFKRLFDLLFSVVVMLLGFPIFAMLFIITKISSPGPAFYKQERLGKKKRTFYIYKFRSMYIDAEKFGPQLSSESDPRITKWGRVIRRTRLDELPQFWNVLKGDMSVVGPRPERHYFIEQIVEKKPEYLRLQHIKPGITSMGQVHYGYAESVDEMCERMQFDLNYLQAVNFKTDFQVICKTVMVMLACKGK